MRVNRNRSLAAGLIVAAIGTIGPLSWSQAVTSAVKDTPLVVSEVKGSELRRLTLSKRAVERLGIKTKPITTATRAGTGVKLSIPYSALIYDKNGATWVYTNPESLVFIRQAVTVQTIVRDVVFLLNGPRPGTKVATVGVSELFGAELGVGGGH